MLLILTLHKSAAQIIYPNLLPAAPVWYKTVAFPSIEKKILQVKVDERIIKNNELKEAKKGDHSLWIRHCESFNPLLI